MSWIHCPRCGVKRSVEQISIPEGWSNPSCWNCDDPGWVQPYDAEDPLAGRNVMAYEVRCTEESAMKLKERDDSRPEHQSKFQAALGIPVVIDENVPVGVLEVRSNGVLVKRYHIE